MTDGEPPRRLLRRSMSRTAAPPLLNGDPEGFEGVRLSLGEAQEALVRAADRIAAPRSIFAREPLNILALSGGAAGGAFGAGVLAGLTKAGKRPNFAIVTGVSTGALMAPLAFLGPAWDDRLADAYTGGHAARLLALRRFVPGAGPGLIRGEALDALIGAFIDDELIAGVAAAHAQGRRLFVATTDLDRQRAAIWDMGAIASRALTGDGERALHLFREVLAASASLPGLFPPRLIPCVSEEGVYDEMHVDGGVAAPLFVLPDALLRWKQVGRRLRGGRVYLIVNTILEPGSRITSGNVPAILIRSFDTMLRFSYRQALSLTATFCAGAGLPLEIASITPAPHHGSMMNFDTKSMKRMFDAAFEEAAAGKAWTRYA
ncbi:MAG: patatin [Caulobacterales bacterium 68-7]|nr:patatin-like phospholipase family protein [Caulobacterales bacterium]OJU08879.1 MAG: patatin [Caulobacterales bacterium 68-7]